SSHSSPSMPSLGIAPGPKGCDGRFLPVAGPAPGSDVFPADVNFRLLEIGRQAIKPSPYHAGPPVRRAQRLGPATGFLACSCPLPLSAPGKPSEPRTSLRVPPGYAGDATGRLVAHNMFSICHRALSQYSSPTPVVVVSLVNTCRTGVSCSNKVSWRAGP